MGHDVEQPAPALEVGEQAGQGLARPRPELVGPGQAPRRARKRDAVGAGQAMEGLQGGLAQAALGHVDDALERQVVAGLGDDAQVRHGVADLLALVEPGAADHPVGHGEGDQALFELAGLEPGAHQHRHLVQGVALGVQGLDLFAGDAGLLLAVPDAEHAHLLAGAEVGPERLAQPSLVVGDERRRGAQDVGRGAVVALQADHPGAGEIALEAQDVADLGAAPRIDRLVVVADAAQVPVRLRQEAQPQVLGHVGVLVFIHQDVAEPALVSGEDLGVVLKQREGVQKQVAEIGGVHGLQAVLVVAIQGQHPATAGVRAFRVRDPVRRQAAVLPALDDAEHGAGRQALLVDAVGLDELLDQPELVVLVEDGEIGRQPDGLGVGAQDARPQGMEGAHPPALHRPRQEDGDPVPHLARRPVGKRHRQHLAGPGQAADQDVGEAADQHPGLAGAGAGEHQHRSLRGLDGGPLGVVEALQVGHVRRRPGVLGRGRAGRRAGELERIGHGRNIARGRALSLGERKFRRRHLRRGDAPTRSFPWPFPAAHLHWLHSLDRGGRGEPP